MSNSCDMLRTVLGTYGHSVVLGIFPLSGPRSGVRRLNKEGVVGSSWESCFSAA